MEDTFHGLCSKLCSFCVLIIPLPSDTFQLHMDASALGVIAVLNVIREDKEYPVAFYTRQFRGAEKVLCNRVGGLAVVAAVHHFLSYLYARYFTMVTDHRVPNDRTTRTQNKQLQGWALKLQCFQFTIVYREGEQSSNVMAYRNRLGRHHYLRKQYATRIRIFSMPRTASAQLGGMWSYKEATPH